MALRAHLWAMDDAPVDDSTGALILIALADEAADDGTGACPYIEKLMQRGRCSKRTVQNTLRALFQARLINNGDPRVAMRRYGKGAGQAPRCWDLNLEATRENVPEPRTDDEMKRDYSPMIGVKPPRLLAAPAPAAAEAEGGVQDLHPSPDLGKQGEAGVQILHPLSGVQVQPTAPEGCSPLHPRGAASCTLPAVDLSVPETPLPPAVVETAPAVVADDENPGGEAPQTNPEPIDLNRAVDAAVAERADVAGWSTTAVRRAVREARDAGFSDEVIVAGLAAIAVDRPRAGRAGTQYPARLRHWLAAEARKANGVDGEEMPASYAMPPDRPRCKTHPGYPGDNCTACVKDEQIAAAEAARAKVEAARASTPATSGPETASSALLALRAQLALRNGKAAALAGHPVPPAEPVDQAAGDQAAPVDKAELLERLDAFGAQLEQSTAAA